MIRNILAFYSYLKAIFLIKFRTKVLFLDIHASHSRFTEILCDKFGDEILVIKYYTPTKGDVNFKHEVHLNNSFLLKHLPLNYIFTFSSHISKNYLPKRTKVFHLPHSLVSLHGIYTIDAFKDIDCLFSTGPHHTKEFQELCRYYHWDKDIREVGYLKIDRLKEIQSNSMESSQRIVLFAPSWGINNAFRRHGIIIINNLLREKWKIIVRPHPLSFEKDSDIITNLKLLSAESKGQLILEGPTSTMQSFITASVMITDWSGAAYEFAFALCKPVLFLDVPVKITNQNSSLYPAIDLCLMEDELRSKIGIISRIDNVTTDIELLFSKRADYSNHICEIRNDYLYNIGTATSVAWTQIQDIITSDFEND